MTISAITIETCPDNLRCLHGSSCREDRLLEEMYTCDCTAISAENGKFFSGRYCEFEATELCQVNPGSVVDYELSFCVNGGTCEHVYDIASEVEHKGCKNCPAGYEGDRCQFIAGSSPRPFYGVMSGDSGSGMGGLQITLVVLLCILFMLGVAYYFIVQRKKKYRDDSSEMDKLHPVVSGTGDLPTVESIRNSFDVDGANQYPVNHSALLRKLAKTGKSTPSRNTVSRTGSGSKPSVVQFDHDGIGVKSVKPYRDEDYDSPAPSAGRNSIGFSPDDESDGFHMT